MRRPLLLSLALSGITALGCGPPSLATLDQGSTTQIETSADNGDADVTDGPQPTSETNPTLSSTTGEDPDPDPDLGQIYGCSTFQQDCPEGQKCVPYGSTGGNWDATKCVPILGDQAWGEPCHYDGLVEATDDCDAMTHCWDVQDIDGKAMGICTLFCQGTPDDPMCPPDYACYIASEGAISFCIFQCDPLAQDCNEGSACFWANNGFNCIFTTQDLPLGEACNYINDCAAGLICLTAEVMLNCDDSSACCGAFCDLGLGDAPCEAAMPGTVCANFFEPGMAPPEQAHIGVCILPGP